MSLAVARFAVSLCARAIGTKERTTAITAALAAGGKELHTAATSRKSASIDDKVRQLESACCSASAARDACCFSQTVAAELFASLPDAGSIPAALLCCDVHAESPRFSITGHLFVDQEPTSV